MLNYDDKIEKYISEHREEIVNTLLDLVKIPSVADTKGAVQALEMVTELFEGAGARVENRGGYALATMGDKEHKIGLFSHADVVPGGNGWTVCEPFEPTVKDGYIFGRGAWDDKSAIVISLYAFKIIKELSIDINSALVAFVGGNEETTMQDIKDYKKTNTPPTVSMVLDAAFPVYLGDKGMLWLECEMENGFEDLIELTGGEAINITLKCATAKLRYSKELYEELSCLNNISVCASDEVIKVTAEGISAHGAAPKGTINGGAIILDALFECPSFSQRDKERLAFLRDILKAYDGTPLKIEARDSLFGDTTATNGIIDITKERAAFTLDIRYGDTYTEKTLLKAVDKALLPNGISYKIVKNGEPKAISPHNKYVVACLDAYRKHTNDTEACARINAGGTYSRFLENAFECGTTLKYSALSLPSGHGGAHQPDEHISVDGLLGAIHMIVKMIIACDEQGFKQR